MRYTAGRLITILLFALFLWFPMPIAADEHGEHFIIQFESQDDRGNWLETIDRREYTLHDSITGVSLVLTNGEVRHLKQSVPGFETIVVNSEVSVNRSSTASWGFETVNQTNLSPFDETGEGIRISIIDTGIEQDHPNLSYTEGVCKMTTSNACPNGYQDDNGHGTHVAGIISAQGLNDVSGVAPDAELFIVKTMDYNGDGRIADVISGIEWSLERDVDLINLSITTEYYNFMLNESIEYAAKQGVILVGAVGNVHQEDRPVLFPARHPDVIAVASVNINGEPSRFSAYGPEVVLAAPGEAILSTDRLSMSYDGTGGYSVKTGTSMAAPFVTGVAALYMERYPYLNRRDLTEVMTTNADKPEGTTERNDYLGYGIVQVPRPTGEPVVNPVPLIESGNGQITLTLGEGEEQTYTIYRNGIQIAEGVTDNSFSDYVHGGTHMYEVFLEEDGLLTYYGKTARIDTEGVRFNDIRASSWYYRDVYFLTSSAITKGFTDGSFRPYRNLTRAEAVAMIVRALDLEADPEQTWDNSFEDVSQNSFAYEAIHIARDNSIVGGYGDRTFKPNANITRAEVAIMLDNAWFNHYEPDFTASSVFSDIHEEEAAYRAINTLFEKDITSGFPDGTFRGDIFIQRNQYARFMTAVADVQ